MTTHLPERLRDLADDAPGPLSPGGLWQAGRRRHRGRVAAATVIVGCLVAGVAAVGVGGWRSSEPAPATPPATTSGPMSIPDRLYNPSPWLPMSQTPGRLVAVTSATRDHFPFGSDRGTVVGIAAGSQTYRFIDLPGAGADTDVALSPDGRHLAYWLIGRPTGSSVIGDSSIVGIAVLDLVSGSVQRHVVYPEHGLAAGTLGWVGSRTVVMTADHFTSRGVTSYAGRTRAYLFSLDDANGYSRQQGVVRDDIAVVSTRGYAAMVGPRVLRRWDRQNNTYTDIRLSGPVRSLAYQKRQQRIAAVAGNPQGDGPTSGQLLVGRIEQGHAELAPAPGGRSYESVLAWVDATHVVTERLTGQGIVYDAVDTRTGDRRQLVSKPWYAFSIAADALRHPTSVPGIAPPTPWNPRWISLGVLLGLTGAGGVLLLARRQRVRR